MKTKLLFTAALMAATVGTQAVPSTGSSMLVQLLESQPVEETEVSDDANSEEASADAPIDYTGKVPNVFDEPNGTRPAEWQVLGYYSGAPDNNYQVAENEAKRGNIPMDKTVRYLEKYWTGGSMGADEGFYTYITGLPNGNYQVELAASANGAPVYAYVEGSSLVESLISTDTEGSETFKYYTLNCAVQNGVLKIGLRTGTGNTAKWIGLTDISLSYLDGTRGLLELSIQKAEAVQTKMAVTDAELAAAIEAAKTLVEKSDATAAECTAQCATLDDATKKYLAMHASEDTPYDMTDAIVNATCTSDDEWERINGWERNSANQSSSYTIDRDEFNSELYDGIGIEYYTASPTTNADLIWQTLTGMQEGKYKVTIYAAGKTGVGFDLPNEGTLNLFANDAQTQIVSATWAEYSAECSVSSDGILKLGITAGADNGNRWICISNVRLEYWGEENAVLSLAEGDDAYDVAAGTVADVTLTRALKSDKWNTFCVPFDMTAEQLEANGITDVRKLESATTEGESVTLNFSASNLNEVEAGVPYLVKVDASYDGSINVENVLVSAANPTTVSVDGGVSMTGNYAAGNVPTGAYFISDNAFYYADVETVVLKGFRAYINVNGTSEAAGANRLMINLDGEVTGIEDVLGEEAAEADKLVNVVSLDGMTVKAGVKKAEALDGLQKGIYIVDGKKYVVK